MSELGILDLWKDFYPSGRDYIIYNDHNVYSRIDCFFVLKRDRHRMRSCYIGCIDLSDYAPLACTIYIRDIPGKALWRLNTSILNNQQFKTQITKEIKMYEKKENDTGAVDSTMVWDALKAVIRGKVISFCTNDKKEKQFRLINLKDLKDLETQLKREKQKQI